MRLSTRILLGMVVLAFGPAAPAADKGFYLGAGIGRADEDPGSSNGINIALGIPPAGIVHLEPDSVEVDHADTAWSIGAGYRFSRNFAVEVEYLDLGTAEYTEHYTFDSPFPVDSGVITHTYTSSMTGVSVCALASLPVGKDFALFLRGGALFADREVQIPFSLGEDHITYGDTIWLAGAGVDWNLGKQWSVGAEYQRTGEFETTLTAGKAAAERIAVRVRFSF